MIFRWALFTAVLLLVGISNAEQCGQMNCTALQCLNQPKDPKDCASGCLVKDQCNCCNVCAKAKGETCGGINGYYGYCANGLSCDSIMPDIKPGKCSDCKPACSIEFCGKNDKSARCSAKGLILPHDKYQEGCQKTTCGSCFYVSNPHSACKPCSPTDMKSSCIRAYHSCLRKHYLRSAAIQNLTTVSAQTHNTTTGFIFCKQAF